MQVFAHSGLLPRPMVLGSPCALGALRASHAWSHLRLVEAVRALQPQPCPWGGAFDLPGSWRAAHALHAAGTALTPQHTATGTLPWQGWTPEQVCVPSPPSSR